MSHRLDPLLRPKSIALVGASAREGSVGYVTLAQLLQGGFKGDLHVINPRQEEILGQPCKKSILDVETEIEHAIFLVSDARLEQALDDAIQAGIKAATIMSMLVLEEDEPPLLRERIVKKINDAGILLCGANGMGFYNVNDNVWVCGFDTRHHKAPGHVTYISQSGSGMAGIVDVDRRIDFNLAVSTGQELNVTTSDYLNFAVSQPETRVIGLFLETIRDLEAMDQAIEKAKARNIPICAVKVGRTEFAAKMALSHSGAMAGNDDAYNAYFDRHGIIRAHDMDDLANLMIMLSHPHPVGSGGLVSMHDSGGIRQMTIDLADEIGTDLTELTPETIAKLEETLDPGLPAVNPLDAWNVGGDDWKERATGLFTTLLQDPGAALGAVIHDRNPDSEIYPPYIDYMRGATAKTGKPTYFVSGRQGTGSDPLVEEVTREGFPVLDGVAAFLRGVKGLFEYRDFINRPAPNIPTLPEKAVTKWRTKLKEAPTFDEALGAEFLGDFGIPTLEYRIIENENEAIITAQSLGFPLVMKTAEAGIEHKSDVGGVKLDLNTPEDIREAYRDLSTRLGPRAVLVPMVKQSGIEMILGVSQDEKFGPLVMFGFGGIYAETLKDVTFLLPPFGADDVIRKLKSLRLFPLLEGQRGAKPSDIKGFADTVSAFSVLAAEMSDQIQEIDINPILVSEDGAIALDALIVPSSPEDT